MQTITKIQAVDGKLFDNVADCIKHENMIEEIKDAMSILNPVPTDSDFSNGGGFVQQNISIVSKAMVRIVEIAGIEKHPKFTEDPFACRFGIIGRYINDMDIGNNYYLWDAWARFMNMDPFGREWGQSYYARNPHEGKQYELVVERV